MKQILRFTTAGSVDDGKSTLIGRLLFDTNSVKKDQLDAIQTQSEHKGLSHLDFSLLTDGLRAERDQGITIDVAYRYFETAARRFIIADVPGHYQYTRNMITGASNAELVLILVDARKGLTPQTYRHFYIASLLGINQVIVCVNKMDLAGYDELIFNSIKKEFSSVPGLGNFRKIDFIPTVALTGEHVVKSSLNMDWYSGKTLLQVLEEADPYNGTVTTDLRFPIQYVIRPRTASHPDFRSYSGRLAAGSVSVGDEVVVLPSGDRAKIAGIHLGENSIQHAFYPMSVALVLDRDLDAGRGSLIVGSANIPAARKELDVMICWLHDQPLNTHSKFIIRIHTMEFKGMISLIEYVIDPVNPEVLGKSNSLSKNDLARVKLKSAEPVFFDSYNFCKGTGSLIFIDEFTGETLGAGICL